MIKTVFRTYFPKLCWHTFPNWLVTVNKHNVFKFIYNLCILAPDVGKELQIMCRGLTCFILMAITCNYFHGSLMSTATLFSYKL